VSQESSVEKDELGAYAGAPSDRRADQIVAGMRFQPAAYLGGRRGASGPPDDPGIGSVASMTVPPPGGLST
jgi:hypothetical protein